MKIVLHWTFDRQSSGMVPFTLTQWSTVWVGLVCSLRVGHLQYSICVMSPVGCLAFANRYTRGWTYGNSFLELHLSLLKIPWKAVSYEIESGKHDEHTCLFCVQFIYPRLPTSTGKESLHILPVCCCLLSVFPNFSEDWDKLPVAWSFQWLSRIVLVCKDQSGDRVSNCHCKFCTMPNSVVWSLLGSQLLAFHVDSSNSLVKHCSGIILNCQGCIVPWSSFLAQR